MLPEVREDGRPFVPSWVHSAAGLVCLIIAFISAARAHVQRMAPVIGCLFFVRGLATETAVLRARVARLGQEHASPRRTDPAPRS